ncbi:hypothetical protein F5Y08DRAFT_344939 [Xylaria arbuscula]|nr:hypothetical protein F5Y08DRAFT_344939 [Xylaria arbuscula]
MPDHISPPSNCLSSSPETKPQQHRLPESEAWRIEAIKKGRTPLPTTIGPKPIPPASKPRRASPKSRHSGSQSRESSPKSPHELQKGLGFNDECKGVNATTPCTNCRKSRKSNCPCRVARDPFESKTFKCGNCIASKRECSFSYEHPGVQYDKDIMEEAGKNERKKRASRQKANETLKNKKELIAKAEADEKRLEPAKGLMVLRYGFGNVPMSTC